MVGIGDIGVAEHGILATPALGSCVAVCLWDPRTQLAGLLHFMLPSSGGVVRTGERPELYADSGIPLLLTRMGRPSGRRPIHACLVGGSSPPGTSVLAVGRRNLVAARRALWAQRITLDAEDVGGSLARTVRLRAADGRVLVCAPGRHDLVL